MSEETIFVNEKNEVISPPKMSGGTYAPTVARSDKGDLMDKIKPDIIVEIIRHKLMGEEYINGKWVKIEALKSKAITEMGAWDIANLMLSVSSQNVSLSNLTDDEVRSRALEISRTAINMMLSNWKEYGIKGSDQIEFVFQIIFSNSFITLKQPQGEGIRKLLSNTTTEQRLHTTAEEKRGFSLFSKRR